HRRDEIPAVARVRESRAGREQERVVLEDCEPVQHRSETAVQEEFLILVMPDAGEMTGQLPSRDRVALVRERRDRKSTRLNSSHQIISYAVFCLKKKKQTTQTD